MTSEIPPCPTCGAGVRPGKVLLGWRPCRCGGHRYVYCRADREGCGETQYLPPMDPDRCTEIRIGPTP